MILTIGIAQLLDALSHRPARLEFRNRAADLTAIDPVAAEIGTAPLRIANLATRHELLDHVGQFPHAIVLLVSAHIERLPVDLLARRSGDREKGPGDVLEM